MNQERRRTCTWCCLMPDYKRFRWYFTPLLWLAIAYQTWLVSPYWMLWYVGPPRLEDVPQITGVIRQEGELRGRAGSWVPPRTYIDGDGFSRQIHCGMRSEPENCTSFWALRTGKKVKVWYHWYFGVVFVDYIEPNKKPWSDDVTYGFVLERLIPGSLNFVDFRDKLLFWVGWALYIYLIVGCIRQRRMAVTSGE